MDKLQCIEAFVRVAQSGSFTKAAEQLCVNRSVVSARIKQLEDLVGAPLFYRSTRYVRLSDIGEKYYKQCEQYLIDFDELIENLSTAKNLIEGKLRINMAPGFATDFFGSMIADYMRLHPELEVDIIVDDKIIDPISEGFDIVFQMFKPAGDSLIERKLCIVNRIICASPSYLEKFGSPTSPNELLKHDFGMYSGYPSRTRLKFLINNKFEEIQLHPRIQASSVHLLKDFALNDGGIVCLPTLVAYKNLLNGSLKCILQDNPISSYALRAVFPKNSKNLLKIRSLMDFMVAKLDHIPKWDAELLDGGIIKKNQTYVE